MIMLGILIFVLLSISCSLPFSFRINRDPEGPSRIEIATRDPNFEATLYKLLTQTYLPKTATPEPTVTATQQPTLPYFIDGGAERIPQADGSINLVILGSDYRPGAGYRTDIILLIHISPNSKVSFISFPRDLFIPIPGHPDERINTAMQTGGFELVQQMFEFNFGIHPDYFVMTNFIGFESIVDTMGGLDINAEYTLTDWCDLPSGRKGYCTIYAGENHLGGEMALWYARSRYSTSDFDRGRRTQELAKGFFNKLISLDALTNAPAIYQQMAAAVETNLSLDAMLPLAPLASGLYQQNSFSHYTIGPEQTTVFIPASGAYLLLPNTEAIQDVLTEAFGN